MSDPNQNQDSPEREQQQQQQPEETRIETPPPEIPPVNTTPQPVTSDPQLTEEQDTSTRVEIPPPGHESTPKVEANGRRRKSNTGVQEGPPEIVDDSYYDGKWWRRGSYARHRSVDGGQQPNGNVGE